MRARKKKHGKERLEKVSYLFTDKAEKKENRPLYIEIGCGKGKFIIENAEKHPEIDYIGIEKVSDVILTAAEKTAMLELPNVMFMNCDAKILEEKFLPHDVDLIYLNFSDPWPKKGYYKRRLTYRDFLEIYRKILKEDGALFLKTDNTVLFDSSIEELKENGWNLKNITRDLHHSEFAEENIMTEYEKNFSEKGFNINRLEAYLK